MNPPPASSKRSSTTPAAQIGVGLIEVLVAVLVLAIGVLGIAALQTRALSDTSGTLKQSMATVASYSILDMLRADKTAALAGTYNQTVTANSCPAAGSSLSSVQLNAWCNQLASNLGSLSTTTGTINCAPANSVCTITIVYDDSKTTGGSAAQTIAIQAGL